MRQAGHGDIRVYDAPAILSFTEVCSGVALACNLTWVRMCFQSLNLYASYDNGEPLLDRVYLLSIVMVALTLVCAGVFPQAIQRLLKQRAMLIILALSMSASTALMPFSGLAGSAGIAFWLISAVVSGLSSGLFLLYIGVTFALLTPRNIVSATALATILAALLFCVFLLFSPLEASVFALSMPLASALFLYLGARSFTDAKNIQTVGELLITEITDSNFAVNRQGSNLLEHKSLARLVMSIAICSCLVGFSNEMSRTIFVQLGIVGTVDGWMYAIIQGATGFACTVGTVVIALALFNAQTPQMPKYCYRLTGLFLIVGVAGLPISLIYPQANVFIPYALNTASYQWFGLMVWIMTAGICRRYFAEAIRAFAFIRAGWAIGPLAGILLGRILINHLGLNLEMVFPAMFASLLAILVAFLCVFTENDLLDAMNITSFERHQRFREKCIRVIETYGLTKREGEIMIMFAKGRNLAHIQEQLYLSRSTISTHRQHIYRKLDIHSAQELLDLIQKA